MQPRSAPDHEETIRQLTARLEEAEKRERRLRAFLESASQSVVAVAQSGAIVLVNAATEELFGYSREELLGASLEVLLPERLRGQHVAHRTHYFSVPRSRPMGVGMELAGRKKDGTEFPLEISLSFVSEPETNIALALITDISERKRIEEQMRQTQKLESLGVLAGGIAHDFNNLLVGIIGNASLGIDQLSPNHPLRATFGEVLSASQRAADLTRQLLAYAGKGRFVINRVDMSVLIREITALVRSSIPPGVQLRLDLESRLPAVAADSAQMQQLIMNLVINAAESIGDNEGTIIAATTVVNADAAYITTMLAGSRLEPGKYVAVEVQDSGCGMNEETISRIFDPFFTTKFMGRGLGLAAALGIVQGHKGAIKVYSTPGKGSTFKVLIPVAEGGVSALPARDIHEDLSGDGLVLVIDDEEVVRRTVKSSLQRYGYNVLTAEDGQSGIDTFRELKERIRVVILDMTMPGLDGQETLRVLKTIDSGVRVLLSSGFNEVEAIRRFTGKGIAGFIQKPYTAVQLAEKVKRTLNLPRAAGL
jgi:PAS domain S-box-containing protein